MKKIFFLLLYSVFAVYATETPVITVTTTCAPCHGVTGISTNPLWPNLAGQHARYLVKQLTDFKQKKRTAATMLALVSQLSPKDITDLSAFYAHKPIPDNKTPKQYLARGQQLYRGGDFNQHITACIACHGPKGTGNGEAGFPVLSGQQPAYTIQQLEAFKNKERRNDLNAIMQDISARMSADDIKAVAYYVAGLH